MNSLVIFVKIEAILNDHVDEDYRLEDPGFFTPLIEKFPEAEFRQRSHIETVFLGTEYCFVQASIGDGECLQIESIAGKPSPPSFHLIVLVINVLSMQWRAMSKAKLIHTSN
jgi:hypothetical protein